MEPTNMIQLSKYCVEYIILTDTLSRDYTQCMSKQSKQTTMRFTEQDMAAITRIRELYGCISDTAAVRLALQIVARQAQAPNPSHPKR